MNSMRPELTPKERAEIKKHLLLARIVAVSLVSAVFFYAYIAHVVVQKGNLIAQSESSVNAARIALYILVGAGILIAPWMRKLLLSRRDSISRAALDSHVIQRIAAKGLVATVSVLAVYEAMVLYGLVLTFMSGRMMDFYCFTAVGLAGLLYYFPRYSQWEDWLVQNMDLHHG